MSSALALQNNWCAQTPGSTRVQHDRNATSSTISNMNSKLATCCRRDRVEHTLWPSNLTSDNIIYIVTFTRQVKQHTLIHRTIEHVLNKPRSVVLKLWKWLILWCTNKREHHTPSTTRKISKQKRQFDPETSRKSWTTKTHENQSHIYHQNF